MTTPDLSAYIDLTINDRDPQSLYEDAVTNMQVDFPDWTPREGNIEVVLLEAFALMVSEAVFAINRLPDGVVQAILKFYGIERDPGSPATTTVQFNMGGAAGYTIPEDTSVAVETLDGSDPVIFHTDIELVIAVGQVTGTVAATSDENTSRANGIIAGTLLELVDSNIYVDSAEIDSEIAGGSDEETDQEYLIRAVNRFQRMSDTLVTANDFKTFIAEYAAVKKVTVVDPWEAGVGATAGHITAVVYGDNGVVSTAQKNVIIAAVEAMKQINLIFHIIDSVIQTINVDVSLKYFSNFVQADVVNNVEEAIREYLSPSTWSGGSVVRRNELIALVSNVPGVDYVSALTTPAADVTLTNPGDLPEYGTITVNATV